MNVKALKIIDEIEKKLSFLFSELANLAEDYEEDVDSVNDLFTKLKVEL
jgi:hypothetical protein